jgi:hypothetical protein
MRAVAVGFGLAACLLLAFSYTMAVQAQTCCVSVENVDANSSGISGQFIVTNVAVNTEITYSWYLAFYQNGGQTSVNSGNGSGTVESPGSGTFPFWCQMPSQFPGPGQYSCYLIVSVQGGYGSMSPVNIGPYTISG